MIDRAATGRSSAGGTRVQEGACIHPVAMSGRLVLLLAALGANAATPAATPEAAPALNPRAALAAASNPERAAPPAPTPRFERFAEAVQHVLMGYADTAEVAEDTTARPMVEKAIGQKTRVRVLVRKIADLGGDGCKRIGTQFIALDVQVQNKEGQPAGLWAGEMAMNLCEGGQPPEPAGS